MNTRATKRGIVSGNLHGFVADGAGNSAPDLDSLTTNAIGLNKGEKPKGKEAKSKNSENE